MREASLSKTPAWEILASRRCGYRKPTPLSPFTSFRRKPESSYRRRFIALFEGTKKGEPQSLVIARENKDGSTFFNFIAKEKINSLDNQRVGTLRYRKGSQ